MYFIVSLYMTNDLSIKSVFDYIHTLNTSSFDGWDQKEINAYKKALISVGEKLKLLNANDIEAKEIIRKAAEFHVNTPGFIKWMRLNGIIPSVSSDKWYWMNNKVITDKKTSSMFFTDDELYEVYLSQVILG